MKVFKDKPTRNKNKPSLSKKILQDKSNTPANHPKLQVTKPSHDPWDLGPTPQPQQKPILRKSFYGRKPPKRTAPLTIPFDSSDRRDESPHPKATFEEKEISVSYIFKNVRFQPTLETIHEEEVEEESDMDIVSTSDVEESIMAYVKSRDRPKSESEFNGEDLEKGNELDKGEQTIQDNSTEEPSTPIKLDQRKTNSLDNEISFLQLNDDIPLSPIFEKKGDQNELGDEVDMEEFINFEPFVVIEESEGSNKKEISSKEARGEKTTKRKASKTLQKKEREVMVTEEGSDDPLTLDLHPSLFLYANRKLRAKILPVALEFNDETDPLCETW